MSEHHQASGGCLCGAVRFQVNGNPSNVGACHCDMCLKWSGAPLMTVDCGSDVTFAGKDNIATFTSSKWAERGFCKRCGSNLYYRLPERDQYIMLAGLFDDKDGFVFDHQVFIDEKPDYYSFANKTHDMTGAEVFAMFGAAEE